LSNYEEVGHDYFNAPAPQAPGYLSERGRKLFTAIQNSLVAQAREGHINNRGEGILIFRGQDHYLEVDCRVSVTQLVEAVEAVLPKEDE
jgi:hypothetical protein